jgi:hypothetical protein
MNFKILRNHPKQIFCYDKALTLHIDVMESQDLI